MDWVLLGLWLVVLPLGCGGGNAPPSCESTCPRAVAAGCSHGPPSAAGCDEGCQAVRAAGCIAQYDAFARCAEPAPVYMCDSLGRVTVDGCQTDSEAIYTCLAGG